MAKRLHQGIGRVYIARHFTLQLEDACTHLGRGVYLLRDFIVLALMRVAIQKLRTNENNQTEEPHSSKTK